MGGGDLNMKKSWHPLLLKNQERVWLEEKKALEEKKKLDQLRKEKEEERQLQELQRLQEEQTGKKRTEKLDWMYTTPATGSSQNPNDLEDYLLGKKRVDKILTADDNAKLGAAHKNFIAVQNANNTRDIASKIREDPLLAIKQQEQAAYEALMSNPLRLRELQERNGVKPKKEKKREKEEKKRRKEEKRRLKDRLSRSPSPLDSYRRSESEERYSRSRRSPSPHSRDDRHRGRRYSRSRSPPRRSYDDRSPRRDSYRSSHHRHSYDSDDDRRVNSRRRSASPRRSDYRRYSRSPRRDHEPAPSYSRRPPPPSRPEPSSSRPLDDDRAARLAAMSANASSMSSERRERLKGLLEKEKAEMEAEERARLKSQGMGSFLSQESKKVFGGTGGLEERIRRGRGGLVVDTD